MYKFYVLMYTLNQSIFAIQLVGEAEQAFLGVLRIEGDSKDAKHELEQIKVRQIMVRRLTLLTVMRSRDVFCNYLLHLGTVP